MASTTFSGPVTSTNGFIGAVTATGVASGELAVTGDSDLLGAANVIVIPTVDPAVAGAIWNNAGVLSVSAG
jgi:hypothetical protein